MFYICLSTKNMFKNFNRLKVKWLCLDWGFSRFLKMVYF